MDRLQFLAMASSSKASSSSQIILEEAKKLRSEEIEVAQSIFEQRLLVKDMDNGGLMVDLEVLIDLGGQWQINLIENGTALASSDPACPIISLQLSYLPPIRITLLLPNTYPLEAHAKLVTAHAAHSWLNQTSLRAAVQQIVDDHPGGVIWPLLEYVRDGTVLSALHLDSPSSSQTLNLPHPTPHLLVPHLLSHNKSAANLSFASTPFDCPVCLSTVKGSHCIRIESCGHVACRDCLAQFWTMSIQTGEVERVGCVDEECVKGAAKLDDFVRSGVSEEEVRNVVGEMMLKRWQVLREKRMIERDPTIVQCPVELCQAPVPCPVEVERNAENEDEWNRLRVCPSCNFSFCLACRRSWHGPITPCKTVAVEQFLNAYRAAKPDSAERLHLERQYGKRQILKFLSKHKEAKANKAWLEQNTMACPGCRINVEKTMGCNH
ncbi:translation termination inhibitor protein itt1, partial [Tulasnella sp. 417]